MITLIGPDRDLFLKGRRCENQGLGIGAAAYYRRVVENQKNRLFDEIIKVAKKNEPDSQVIRQLEAAKQERVEQALKDEAALSQAIAELLNPPSNKEDGPEASP